MSTLRADLGRILGGRKASARGLSAVGVRPASSKDDMNKLEAEYAAFLDLDPSVVFWSFQAMKLRIAKRTWYTPDFLVMRKNGRLQIHETKGHWEDDARVKWKVIRELFPFEVFAITKEKGGGFKIEEASPAEEE